MKPAVVARRSLDDRGDTSVQMAIVFPFIILLTIAVVQVSLWYYARNVALTAAREGVAAARVYESGPGAGAARAQDVLGRIAGNTLLGPSVSTGGSSAERIRIQVTGRAPSLLPGVPGLTITQSASGPVERWTTGG
ncbi:pilus assembly protein [Streptomyces sp. col6]|uniref:TadE family protein n=1 Tax=Streptomyces sp. col6 TaxID=2478958 RepID=UPI0011CDE92B|nr:TadE family protein [Streptomyces sp. col6]TXS06940.1 pilus assembly protein [Streptomyces sp. col6]